MRTVIIDGAFAARFDDLNGDGREIELGVFAREAGHWFRIGHQDDVAYPGDDAPLFGWSRTLGWAVGRGTPGERLEVDWMGGRAEVGVDADGWWLAVVSGEGPRAGEEPSFWLGPRTRPLT